MGSRTLLPALQLKNLLFLWHQLLLLAGAFDEQVLVAGGCTHVPLPHAGCQLQSQLEAGCYVIDPDAAALPAQAKVWDISGSKGTTILLGPPAGTQIQVQPAIEEQLQLNIHELALHGELTAATGSQQHWWPLLVAPAARVQVNITACTLCTSCSTYYAYKQLLDDAASSRIRWSRVHSRSLLIQELDDGQVQLRDVLLTCTGCFSTAADSILQTGHTAEHRRLQQLDSVLSPSPPPPIPSLPPEPSTPPPRQPPPSTLSPPIQQPPTPAPPRTPALARSNTSAQTKDNIASITVVQSSNNGLIAAVGVLAGLLGLLLLALLVAGLAWYCHRRGRRAEQDKNITLSNLSPQPSGTHPAGIGGVVRVISSTGGSYMRLASDSVLPLTGQSGSLAPVDPGVTYVQMPSGNIQPVHRLAQVTRHDTSEAGLWYPPALLQPAGPGGSPSSTSTRRYSHAGQGSKHSTSFAGQAEPQTAGDGTWPEDAQGAGLSDAARRRSSQLTQGMGQHPSSHASQHNSRGSSVQGHPIQQHNNMDAAALAKLAAPVPTQPAPVHLRSNVSNDHSQPSPPCISPTGLDSPDGAGSAQNMAPDRPQSWAPVGSSDSGAPAGPAAGGSYPGHHLPGPAIVHPMPSAFNQSDVDKREPSFAIPLEQASSGHDLSSASHPSDDAADSSKPVQQPVPPAGQPPGQTPPVLNRQATSGEGTSRLSGAPAPAQGITRPSEEWDPNKEVAALAQELQGHDSAKLQLIELIGQGAHGSVYRGIWRNLEVAVKTVMFSDRTGMSSTGVMGVTKNSPKKRAIMEAAVCTSMSHQNVVCTYHYDITPIRDDKSSRSQTNRLFVESATVTRDYKLYLVQEYCDASLHAVLGAHILHDPAARRPNMDLVLTVLLDIARGMDYIHKKNIIHGDLKPENVLLKNDTTSPIGVVAKVTDFGLSATLNPGDTHLSNMANGTPFYSAPEVVSAGKVTRASDVYSFGVLMWETYRCMPPWVRTKTGGYMANPRFRRFPQDTPLPFVLLCAQCLDKNPKTRPIFQTILEALSLMHAALLAGYPGLIKTSGKEASLAANAIASAAAQSAASVGMALETPSGMHKGWYHGMPSVVELPPQTAVTPDTGVGAAGPSVDPASQAARPPAQVPTVLGAPISDSVPAQQQQHLSDTASTLSKEDSHGVIHEIREPTIAQFAIPDIAMLQQAADGEDDDPRGDTGVQAQQDKGEEMTQEEAADRAQALNLVPGVAPPAVFNTRNASALQSSADRRAGGSWPSRREGAQNHVSFQTQDDVRVFNSSPPIKLASRPLSNRAGSALSTQHLAQFQEQLVSAGEANQQSGTLRSDALARWLQQPDVPADSSSTSKDLSGSKRDLTRASSMKSHMSLNSRKSSEKRRAPAFYGSEQHLVAASMGERDLVDADHEALIKLGMLDSTAGPSGELSQPFVAGGQTPSSRFRGARAADWVWEASSPGAQSGLMPSPHNRQRQSTSMSGTTTTVLDGSFPKTELHSTLSGGRWTTGADSSGHVTGLSNTSGVLNRHTSTNVTTPLDSERPSTNTDVGHSSVPSHGLSEFLLRHSMGGTSVAPEGGEGRAGGQQSDSLTLPQGGRPPYVPSNNMIVYGSPVFGSFRQHHVLHGVDEEAGSIVQSLTGSGSPNTSVQDLNAIPIPAAAAVPPAIPPEAEANTALAWALRQQQQQLRTSSHGHHTSVSDATRGVPSGAEPPEHVSAPRSSARRMAETGSKPGTPYLSPGGSTRSSSSGGLMPLAAQASVVLPTHGSIQRTPVASRSQSGAGGASELPPDVAPCSPSLLQPKEATARRISPGGQPVKVWTNTVYEGQATSSEQQ